MNVSGVTGSAAEGRGKKEREFMSRCTLRATELPIPYPLYVASNGFNGAYYAVVDAQGVTQGIVPVPPLPARIANERHRDRLRDLANNFALNMANRLCLAIEDFAVAMREESQE